MRLDNLTGEIQAQACPRRLLCGSLVAAPKLLEDECYILCGEARSPIDHLNADPRVLTMGAQRDGRIRRRVLGGIVEQIAQYLADALGITPDAQIQSRRHGERVVSQRGARVRRGGLEEDVERNRTQL